jgi:hypothetical protein
MRACIGPYGAFLVQLARSKKKSGGGKKVGKNVEMKIFSSSEISGLLRGFGKLDVLNGVKIEY